jgi:hypothetical protein
MRLEQRANLGFVEVGVGDAALLTVERRERRRS